MESMSQDRMSASAHMQGNQNMSQSYEGDDGQRHHSKRKGVSLTNTLAFSRPPSASRMSGEQGHCFNFWLTSSLTVMTFVQLER